MTSAWKSLLGIFALLLVAMPAMAERAPKASRSGRGSAGAARVAAAAAPSARSYTAPSSSGYSGSATPGGYYGGTSRGGYARDSYVSPGGIAVRSLNNTSFNSYSGYYHWNQFYGYLYQHYNLNPYYFNRFFRNTEPLITPSVLKLGLRESILLSSQLVDMIDQLQWMIGEAQAGREFDKKALVEQTKLIRKLAKEIRKNKAIAYIDLRKEQKIYQKPKKESDMLNPEALDRLREMAIDLNNQLKTMHNKPSTQTVAVDHFKQPSFKSLAKGIEKLSKDIEKSIKKTDLTG